MVALYESVEETSTRLYDTVFMYKDQPVYCHGVNPIGGGEIQLSVIFYPRAVEEAKVKLTDPDLEYRRFNVGYVNLQNGASYAYRNPTRGRYKQGLCKDNLMFTRCSPEMPPPDFSSVIKTIGFKDMMQGKYPSITEAVTRLSVTSDDRPPVSVAFDRNFALSFDRFRKDFLLFYKGERIGFGSDAFQVPDEFSYLRELITQTGINMR